MSLPQHLWEEIQKIPELPVPQRSHVRMIPQRVGGVATNWSDSVSVEVQKQELFIEDVLRILWTHGPNGPWTDGKNYKARKYGGARRSRLKTKYERWKKHKYKLWDKIFAIVVQHYQEFGGSLPGNGPLPWERLPNQPLVEPTADVASAAKARKKAVKKVVETPEQKAEWRRREEEQRAERRRQEIESRKRMWLELDTSHYNTVGEVVSDLGNLSKFLQRTELSSEERELGKRKRQELLTRIREFNRRTALSKRKR